MNRDRILAGKGTLHWGTRLLGWVTYKVHLDATNGQASVVELMPKPAKKDGTLVHLTLEDGRVVNCQVLGKTPFCAVVGDGPIVERRKVVRLKQH